MIIFLLREMYRVVLFSIYNIFGLMHSSNRRGSNDPQTFQLATYNVCTLLILVCLLWLGVSTSYDRIIVLQYV